MKSVTEKAGIERRLTNHVAKKHNLQTLRVSKQASADIMQISVHKNLQSITNYSSMSLESQKLQNFERLLSSNRAKGLQSPQPCRSICMSLNQPNANLERNSAMQPIVSGTTYNMYSHQQVHPSVTPPGRPPPLTASLLSAQPGSTPENLNSVLGGYCPHS